jgi:hypothetical protein
LVSILLSLTTPAVAADCPAPVPLAEVEARLDEAESAYGALDVDGLTAAVDTLALQLPCLDGAASPELALRLHRARALLQWGEGRERAAIRSLASVKRIDPDAVLPEALVPAGHPLHAAMADAVPSTMTRVPEPLDAELRLDGTVTLDRPTDAPALAQLLDARGTPRWTLLLAASDTLPAYDAVSAAPVVAATPEPVSPMPMPEPATRSASPSRTLWIVSGASAVGAGALYGGAWAANRSFYSYEPAAGASGADARSALESRQTTAGALTAGAISLAAVALGSGATALVLK